MSEGWDLISATERSKSRGGDIIPNIFSLLHPLMQCRIRTLRLQRLARQKSLILTVAMVVGCSIAVTPQCIVESDLECVSDGDSPKLATRPFLFEVVEWSEQLRPVTPVWLGAVRRSVQVRLCTSGCKSEKKCLVLYLPRVICFLR